MTSRIENNNPSSARGLYDLATNECLPVSGSCLGENVNRCQETSLFVDADTAAIAKKALALNAYQPKNAKAIQETEEALKAGQLDIAAIHGLKLRGQLEEIEQEIQTTENKIQKSQKAIGEIAAAQNMAGAPFLIDPWTESQYQNYFELQRTVETLKARQEELKVSLKLAADLAIAAVKEANPILVSNPQSAIISEGRIASTLAALEQYEEATEHFKTAAEMANQLNLKLEAADFRFQAILANHSDEEDWKTRVEKLNDFFFEADREVRMREEGPEGFTQYLESEGDTESWRTLRAEALDAILETYTLYGGSNENGKVGQYIARLMEFLHQGDTKELSGEEILALLNSLQQVQHWHIKEGYELGADAKEEELQKISQKMQEEYRIAEHLFSQHELHPEIREALGSLEASTYFHFWQQAGLPVTAVFSYWNHIRNSPPSETQEETKKLIREKAPHFFDKQGNLLARNLLPFPSDAQKAAYVENSLHYDDASWQESLAIGGGTSFAGAAAGFKLGGLAGTFCGPFAEGCAPAGAVLGSVAGYVGGNEIIDKLHEKERDHFVGEAKQAGMALSRLTEEEADENEMSHFFWDTTGLAMAGIFAPGFGKTGSGIFDTLGWFKKRETWAWVGRRVRHEGKHTLRWIKALMVTGPRAFLTHRAGAIIPASLKPATFTEVFDMLNPWEQARGRDFWRGIWNQLENAKAAAPVIAAKTATPFKGVDVVLGPFNQLYDRVTDPVFYFQRGRLAALRAAITATEPITTKSAFSRFASGRVQAIREAVLDAYPQLAQSDYRMRLVTKLRRAAYEASKNGGTINALRKAAPISGWKASVQKGFQWLKVNVGTNELVRAHRPAIPVAIGSLFYDSDGKQGGGWTLHDWEWDSPLEFGAFFLATNALSAPLIANKVLGADIAGAINLYTIDKMLDLSEYEGPTDYSRLRGAHAHYQVVTLVNSIFISGQHYLSRFPLGQIFSSFPGIRLLPSMVSFPSAYRAGSTLTQPNFLTFSGWGLTFLYQSIGTGYYISEAFSSKPLVNADPYYTWQRLMKYATVVPAVNTLQAALDYRTTLAQTVARVSAVPADIGLSLIFAPFLNKGRHENRMRRLLREDSPQSLEQSWDVFTNANTTLDFGGIVGRLVDETNPFTGGFHWKPLRIGHWRWERRGIETWTSPTPLESLNGRRGFIEELAAAQDWQKINALAEMYRQQCLNPNAAWHKEEADERGMVIFAFMAKYFASRANENPMFGPFRDLVTEMTRSENPELAEFFKRIPTPENHQQLLDFITQADEGKYHWLHQKSEPIPAIGTLPVSQIAPKPPTSKHN